MPSRRKGRRSRWEGGDPSLMPVRTQRSPVDALDDDDDDDYDDGDPVTPPMPSSFRRYHTRWRTGRQPPDGPSSTSPAERATLANDRRGHGVARAAASKQRVFTYRHGHDSIIPFVHRHRHAVSSVAAGRNPPATPGPSSPSYSPLPGAAPPPCAYCQQTREVVEELKTQFDAFTTFRDGLAEAVARNSRVVECHCPGHVDTDGMVGMDWQHEATTLVRYAERRPSHVLRQVLATGVSSGTRDRSLDGLIAAGLAATRSAPGTALGLNMSSTLGHPRGNSFEAMEHSDAESAA